MGIYTYIRIPIPVPVPVTVPVYGLLLLLDLILILILLLIPIPILACLSFCFYSSSAGVECTFCVKVCVPCVNLGSILFVAFLGEKETVEELERSLEL